MPTLSPSQLWQTRGATSARSKSGGLTEEQYREAGYRLNPDGSTTKLSDITPTQTPALQQPMQQQQQQTASLGMSSAPATTTTPAANWWSTPELATQGMATFGQSFPQAAGTDPASLNAIQVKQAQDMLAQIQANFDKQRSATAGYLGGMNMQNSGLGANTLALADNEQSRQQMAAANQLAATLAQANLENNRFNAQYNLDRSGQISNTALGFAQLGANTQNQQADLALRQQQVTNQNSQFYAAQDFSADQADLDRAQQMGMLAAQQMFQGGQSDLQRQHELEVQEIAASNQAAAAALDKQFQMGFLSAQQQFQGGQAQLDRQQQTGMLGMQQSFQGNQAGLDRAQQVELQNAQLNQQLQITMAQLANAAADRSQNGQLETQRLGLQAQQIQAAIEQNKAQNQLTAQGQNNQYALGMADVNLRGQQLGMQQQNQNVQNQLGLLDRSYQGLNLENPMIQQLTQSLGMSQQPQLDRNGRQMPPEIQQQTMSREQFAANQGLPASWINQPYSMGTSQAASIDKLNADYQAYLQQSQPQGMWLPRQQNMEPVQFVNAPSPIFGAGNMGNVDSNVLQLSQAIGNQGNTRQGGGLNLGPAAQSSVLRNLPAGAQEFVKAVKNGTPTNLSAADQKYWMQNVLNTGAVSLEELRRWGETQQVTKNRQTPEQWSDPWMQEQKRKNPEYRDPSFN